MKGDARATKEASPTPTNARQKTRLQNPMAAPLPATASVHTDSPPPISRKPFTTLLACMEVETALLGRAAAASCHRRDP